MEYSAKVIFLVGQIKIGKTTYLTVTTAKPEFKVQIDGYIDEYGLTIDKTV